MISMICFRFLSPSPQDHHRPMSAGDPVIAPFVCLPPHPSHRWGSACGISLHDTGDGGGGEGGGLIGRSSRWRVSYLMGFLMPPIILFLRFSPSPLPRTLQTFIWRVATNSPPSLGKPPHVFQIGLSTFPPPIPSEPNRLIYRLRKYFRFSDVL